MLFFYYTLLMDEADLEKEDPKRVGLENDRIIIEYVKNSLKGVLDSYPTKFEFDSERLSREPEDHKKAVYKYLIAQKSYLIRLIEYYQSELYRLIKEDSL
jgi:hypothetical protein